MKNPGIKNIIFDLGNTLVYFDYCYFYDGVAHLEKKVHARKLRKYFVDNKLDLKIGSNKIDIKKAFKILKKKFNLKIGYSDFYYLYCDIFWENTQMKNFLESKLLDSEYRLFMLSNVDASHINFINKNFPYVRNIKKRVLSYKVKAVKPDKKIYKHLLEKHKLNPGECVFIDDLKANTTAAKVFGINTIHYTSHKRFLKEFNKLTKD
ncbi:MAG TPA: HAD-IA family hydrolase [Ignavibacteria bacterium]|nr:HAD-IA family hydrolase [Ignavibacteria bacterium]